MIYVIYDELNGGGGILAPHVSSRILDLKCVSVAIQYNGSDATES